jgi:benzil reductase ((S)-benzoin forming)
MRAIVTGHSSGLGNAVAKNLLEMGVWVLGISRSSIELSYENFREIRLDLSNLEVLSEALGSGTEFSNFLSCDDSILYNCAGVVEPIGLMGRLDSKSIVSATTINFTSLALIVNCYIRETERYGFLRSVVNVSSGAARNAYDGWSIYCASKAAVDRFSECISLEHHKNLKVESIAPGIIDTPMQSIIRSAKVENFSAKQKFLDLHASKKLLSPDSVAKKLISHVSSERFGESVCTDLREID